MINRLIAFFASLEARLANWLGKRAERKLKERFPHGIEGIVSPIYMTRAKKRGSFRNIVKPGYVPSGVLLDEEEYPGVYEVVYQARLEPHEDFVLSLFEHHNDPDLRDQVLWQGQRIRILEYSCVHHPLHFLVLGESVELYPGKVVILK